jgi:hypothetical protein
MHILWIWFWPATSSNRPKFAKLTTAECISKRLLSPTSPEQTGWNWTCPCVEDNHPLRVAPAGGTDLTRPDHPKQRGPCSRKHAFCGVIPPVNCLNNSGCGYTLHLNSVVNGMLTTPPTIGSTSSRTTDTTIIFLLNSNQNQSSILMPLTLTWSYPSKPSQHPLKQPKNLGR